MPDSIRPVLIVGAGLSGATIARVLADAAIPVRVIEQSAHPGGMCHTSRDPETGVMIHRHGPHIFHSDNGEVWDFVERFAGFEPYAHGVQAVTGGRTFTFPITLDTMSAFFGEDFTGDTARAHIATLARRYAHEPANFEEKGRATIGDALYEAFFEGYTRKQWGMEPALLPPSVFARIPVRFNRDANYFHHRRIGMPRDGYTAMAAAMLDHPLIEAQFGRRFRPGGQEGYAHTVFTGPIDSWFGHRLGRLAYRTLDFEKRVARGSHQPVAQVNYCDMSVPWTRITEHNRFAAWETHEDSVRFVETSRDCGPDDLPYYPVRLADGDGLFCRYREAAQREGGVSFVGRLATFRYIDMDVAIAEALTAGKELTTCLRKEQSPPAFFGDA